MFLNIAEVSPSEKQKDEFESFDEMNTIVAILLLLGKLKVDAMEIYRAQPTVTITLTGMLQSESKSLLHVSDSLFIVFFILLLVDGSADLENITTAPTAE